MEINPRTPQQVIMDMQKSCSLRNDWDIICRELHVWFDEFLAWGAHQRNEAREEGRQEMRKLLQENNAKTYTGYCPEKPQMDKTCLTCKWAEWKTDVEGVCRFPEITFPNCYLVENKYPPMVYCITPNTKPDCLYWSE